MNPVCVLCRTEMVCSKTGLTVANKDNPKWVRSGDLFDCHVCGCEIVLNFGEAFDSVRKAEVLV